MHRNMGFTSNVLGYQIFFIIKHFDIWISKVFFKKKHKDLFFSHLILRYNIMGFVLNLSHLERKGYYIKGRSEWKNTAPANWHMYVPSILLHAYISSACYGDHKCFFSVPGLVSSTWFADFRSCWWRPRLASFEAFEMDGKIDAEAFRHSLMTFGNKFSASEVDDAFAEFKIDDGMIDGAHLKGLMVSK